MTSKFFSQFRIKQIFLSVFLCSTPFTTMAQVELDESFDRFPPPESKWNLCQAARYLNTSTVGQDGQPGTAYRIGIDGFRGTAGCICGKREGCLGLTEKKLKFYSDAGDSDEESELYPVSRIPEPALFQFQSSVDEQCKHYTKTRVPQKNLAQKNEIRLWKDSWPDANIGYWHSFRFRIDGNIDRCGSMRWVGGQIKAGDGKKSPVIAQRFDNGVFHVTIETPIPGRDEKSRRFIVAKSGDGNPDAGSGLQPAKKGVDVFTCDLTDKGNLSSDCQYGGLEHTSHGMLPSVKNGQWVQMDYYVKLEGACKSIKDAKCDRQLEIWAQGEKIATLKGNFGATNAHEALLKFKLGVYRDLQAGDAGIVIDQFTLHKDPDKSWCPRTRVYSSKNCN